MKQDPIENIRESYDRIADEYARRMFRELDGKPFEMANIAVARRPDPASAQGRQT